MWPAASRLRPALPDGPLRLLIVQTAFLGDLVLTLPLLRALRQGPRRPEITLVTTALGRELLDGQELVDEVIVLAKRGADAGFRASWAAARGVRSRRFDVAVAAHRSFRSGLLVRASGATLRVGFAGAPGAWAYSTRLPWAASEHATRRYLALAAPLGVDARGADAQPRLRVSPQSMRRVDELLAGHGIPPVAGIACIAPGSIWPTKRWTIEGFAAVAEALERRGLRTVLVGSAAERELCADIAALVPQATAVVAGRTRLAELVALLARAQIVVANDSGAGHVAAAVGTPLLSIFGPTAPEQGYVAPGDGTQTIALEELDCRPCGRHGAARCPLGHHRCMQELPPGTVVAALDRMMGSGRIDTGRTATEASPVVCVASRIGQGARR